MFILVYFNYPQKNFSDFLHIQFAAVQKGVGNCAFKRLVSETPQFAEQERPPTSLLDQLRIDALEQRTQGSEPATSVAPATEPTTTPKQGTPPLSATATPRPPAPSPISHIGTLTRFRFVPRNDDITMDELN